MKEINAIPSKSHAHRAMICAALSESACDIICDGTSEDIEATINCLVAMKVGSNVMDCGESGSTFRFMIPVLGALGKTAVFELRGRLAERPLSPLYEQLQAHGMTLSEQGSVPFEISGQLEPGVYEIDGGVSSQFITGLLLALPILKKDSRIIIKGKLESKPYVDLTLRVLDDFGIKIQTADDGFYVLGGQTYVGPKSYDIEGDWSNGCFWLCAGALLEEGLKLKGIKKDSFQGDKEIVRLLNKLGAKVSQTEESVTVEKSCLWGTKIDATEIPDMVPVLALLGAVANGTTEIVNAGRLRLKESDRLKTVAETLRKLGADITELPEGLKITGKSGLEGGKVDGAGDHRIVMMAAIASLICKNKVIITGWDAVNKSYPDFFKDLEELGLSGNVERS